MDFSFIEPQQNDFVYFDPPYHKSGESSTLDFHLMKKDQLDSGFCPRINK
ncbi:D12 class N6 adenine-specific DNA methyltransferase family protein [Orientia tsutsugamushi str. Gilliam]|uniref:D12 class N6 adenine-specific DNA methyltransferase family protein n=1 Tax=Orientia tsutsugamushi str. Gilliam TaxID=1359184 RepID=A0A0F3M4X9_ORITS|nr:D12 class N6 adenine-specific DNA methyltransferase family protein [Orientia tsutsugamushi str. Gilliam]